MAIQIRLILIACIVNFGLTSSQHFKYTSDQPFNEMTNETLTTKEIQGRRIRENFQDFFDSIVKSNIKKSETYQQILKEETLKDQQAFDAMKGALQVAQNRNFNRKMNFYNKNYHGESIVAVKRETNRKDPKAAPKIGPTGEPGDIELFKRQFVYRYGRKPYRPWRVMHEADNATFVDLCLNATPAPPKSIGARAEIMRNSSIDCQSFTNEWITMDIVTCFVTYTLNEDGQESGLKTFYLCEGNTPDSIMVFSLAFNKVFIVTKLHHEWPHDFTLTTLPPPTTPTQAELDEPKYETVPK